MGVLAFYLYSAFSGEFVAGLARAVEMADLRSVSVMARRIGGTLMAVFAGICAGAGRHGVSRRDGLARSECTREIGIRMALGAKPKEFFRVVLGRV
jgi:hypothetical protein